MNGFGERPKFLSSDTVQSEATGKEALPEYSSTSMNAISFGFVATAILISMFLIMAFLEHLLRQRPSYPPSARDARGSLGSDTQLHWLGKLNSSQSGVTSTAPDFLVLMPGHRNPTYLAQPAPLPCPREGIHWPTHDHLTINSL